MVLGPGLNGGGHLQWINRADRLGSLFRVCYRNTFLAWSQDCLRSLLLDKHRRHRTGGLPSPEGLAPSSAPVKELLKAAATIQPAGDYASAAFLTSDCCLDA